MADNDQNEPNKFLKDLFNAAKKFISEDINRMTDQFGGQSEQYEQPQQPPAKPKPTVRKPSGKGGSCDL